MCVLLKCFPRPQCQPQYRRPRVGLTRLLMTFRTQVSYIPTFLWVREKMWFPSILGSAQAGGIPTSDVIYWKSLIHSLVTHPLGVSDISPDDRWIRFSHILTHSNIIFCCFWCKYLWINPWCKVPYFGNLKVSSLQMKWFCWYPQNFSVSWSFSVLI